MAGAEFKRSGRSLFAGVVLRREEVGNGTPQAHISVLHERYRAIPRRSLAIVEGAA